jgi:high-affinity iron transporter
LKTVINFIFAPRLVGGVLVCAGLLTAGGAAEAQSAGPRERLAALADYVAADYAGAVQNGKVVTASEYEEQRGLIAEARAIAATLTPSPGRETARAALDDEVRRLVADVDRKAPEAEVAAECRAVHKRLIDDYGLVLSPLAAPSEERARLIYRAACAQCHGDDGRAQTAQARVLQPPPPSFFDDERMSHISPALAFHALTFGIANTGMASYETVPASDRWSLAFFVVSLRHRDRDLHRGERAFTDAHVALAPTASRLAGLSDAQLGEQLSSLERQLRADAIAWLRVGASFAAAPGGAFADARRLLGGVASHADDRPRARELALAAYLEGVEPHEATLRARDRALTLRIEEAFLQLRRTIDAGPTIDADAVRRDVARATMLLDGAEEHRQSERSVPFFAALAITLREGFEIALLIAALLAFVRKSGRPEAAPWVHGGWLLAIPAGAATWFLVGAALGGARRELTEGLLTLVAAAMLLFVSHFVLGKLESRKWLKFLERKTRASLAGDAAGVATLGGDGTGAAPKTRPWPLLTVAFVAAYREAIEIVLFFRALALDSPGRAGAIAAGVAVGGVGLAAIVFAMQQLGRRLNPRPVMVASGVLLTALAISLVGQGVRALQEGGYVPLTPIARIGAGLPSIGLYPTVEGLGTQLVVLLLVLLPLWLERKRANEPKLA